MHNAIKTE